jgi:hypothetical protein
MSLHSKLLAIQSELKAVNKEKTGGHFKNKYFDINMVIEAVKPAFTKHGIVVLQPLTHVEGKLAIETIVSDSESGETMRFVAPVTPSDDPQKMGASITYFRRYALTSLFLIEGEEDNDLQDSKEASKVDDPFTEDCSACNAAKAKGYKTCYNHR